MKVLYKSAAVVFVSLVSQCGLHGLTAVYPLTGCWRDTGSSVWNRTITVGVSLISAEHRLHHYPAIKGPPKEKGHNLNDSTYTGRE